MRCNICDAPLAKPVFNKDINTFEPCQTCLDIIYSVFTDSPEVIEGEAEAVAAVDAEVSLEELYEVVKNLT